ncbi:hypothetical protein ABFS82_06G173500 [Erythranthe guttata]|uniref:F-box/kelch-repeat protein At3g23880-like n=1 Tax=Erythranthe guttata TaxID=4155 RepID=UPI00064DD3AF|nr:PREDICTED: F-box/kelch-repeat protein At3g23880-like [Erythranthe guttata]|eukprot:XP_012834879.1 PREDICTED: F-box/kelch-repeat protein At3g23880-like [Erythranthe guttata]
METKSSDSKPPTSSDHHQPSRITRRRIQTPASAAAAAAFPEELIEEILSRLPVNSLLKFRSVSKSWRALISDKKFISAHLKNSSKNTNFTLRRIISTIILPYYTLKHCSLHSLLSGPLTNAVDSDYPMKNPQNSVRIVGCCNGLVCIAVNGKHFFIWNPSTKKYKKLPDVDDFIEQGLFITKYGFGFDESNDDYKVVGILSGFCNRDRYETMVKVYSLRTNSWKRIDVFNDGLPFDDTAKFVSGKLHWGKRNGSNSKWDIVSFDLASGVCGNVARPSYVETDFSPSLGVLGGCLCVLSNSRKSSVDVWVMKEYGVSESWTKIVTVPYLDVPWEGPYSTPLCVGSNGEILLMYGSNLMIYSPRDNRFRRPKIRNFGAFLEADVYCESLVPLV